MQFIPQVTDTVAPTMQSNAVEVAMDEENPNHASRTTMEVTKISNKILDIIFEYALNKFNNTVEQLAVGRPQFLSVINQFIIDEAQLQMCLPAFPFKSANKVDKVFGILPDKAEELALERLNSMCIRIGDIYSPGAKLTIISDGLVYNDLLGIPDRDTWAYGEALRTMAVRKGFDHIDFSRLRDLVNFPLPEKLEEITYVANATNFRRFLFNNYGKDNFDIDHEIATNPDTQMTYLGYRRFLESDLKYIFPLSKSRSNHAYKRDVKYLAKQMLIRGYVNIYPIPFLALQVLQLIIARTGFCGGSQTLLSETFAPLDPPIYRRAQGIHELAQYKNRIHDSVALQRRFDGGW
ncbi:MAG: hypothetical protein Q9170_003598 [Blastenia crenularia]